MMTYHDNGPDHERAREVLGFNDCGQWRHPVRAAIWPWHWTLVCDTDELSSLSRDDSPSEDAVRMTATPFNMEIVT